MQTNQKCYRFARWLCWFFLVASVLALLYTYYRAEMIHYGEHNASYLKYYIVSLAGICLWGVVLRLQAGIQANVVTVIVALMGSLYLAEGGLILLKKTQRSTVAASLGIEFDQRTRKQVIKDLRQDGVDAVPSVTPTHNFKHGIENNTFLPLAGISGKMTVGGNEGGQRSIYPSDRYGFNNPDGVWDLPETKWLLLGDSFTHGATVQPGEDIAGQLRTMTNNNVINLGMGGNGPLIELATLKEYAEMMQPQRVLWIYFEGNDLTDDLPREKESALLLNYLQDGFSQNLTQRQEEIDRSLGELMMKRQTSLFKGQLRGWIELYRTQRLLYRTWRLLFTGNVHRRVDIGPLFAEILATAKARVESCGGQFYFVYLPGFRRYTDTSTDHGLYRKKAEVIALVRGLNIPVIDIHATAFAVDPDLLAWFPMRLGWHYNANGYSAVAKYILETVQTMEAL